MNRRIFVRKKDGFRTVEKSLLQEFKTNLKLENLKTLELYNVYDVFNIDDETFESAKKLVFTEPNIDDIYETFDFSTKCHLGVAPLPEQFDMRANSAEECIKILNSSSDVKITTAELLIFNELEENDISKIKNYYINAIESTEKDFSVLEKRVTENEVTLDIIQGFIEANEVEVTDIANNYGVALNKDNIVFVQDYFKKLKRNPTLAELKVIDTYWSDHCRHSTFNTPLTKITFEDKEVEEVYNEYLTLRGDSKKAITLMDMAIVYAKYAKRNGIMTDMEDTEENNACSIEVEIEVDGKKEIWLHQFKNETHNHPTEIEPFGGAATCLGGAIRDPLSGRAFVFQGLRVSGAGDITKPIEETIEGKLPQRQISIKATKGFSSYGNQIGLATTYIDEITHPSYETKRLECGAVVGAVKKENVLRENPVSGDIIILLGGKTGKDGIGGATGSSKSQDENSIKRLGGEVQKGNALEERKLQRLFRNPEFSKLVKKSNDFGAGGVSVAIGELADSIHVYLERIKLKDTSLKPFEIAISESQERMAIVVEKQYLDKIFELAEEENVSATYVADVTDTKKIIMTYNDLTIIDIENEFLDTNGVFSNQEVVVKGIDKEIKENLLNRTIEGNDFKEQFINNLTMDNVASKKGMEDIFDFSVLGTTVLAPYGGKYQLTRTQSSIQKFPTDGFTNDLSAVAVGFNPYLSEKSPYYAALCSNIHALSKLVANGVDYRGVRFSLQEYFERLGEVPEKWGKVVSALMGALKVHKEFGLPAIGGKDSMSGTFNEMNVVPTLIAFAFTHDKVENIISNEFKKEGNYVYLLKNKLMDDNSFNFDNLKKNFDFVLEKAKNKKIVSAFAVSEGGVGEALAKMSFGNKLGVNGGYNGDLFALDYGSFVLESTEQLVGENLILIGEVNKNFNLNCIEFKIEELIDANFGKYNSVYKMDSINEQPQVVEIKQQIVESKPRYKEVVDDVKVFIPVFPGTNSEFDTKRVFENAGCTVNMWVFNNQSEKNIQKSINEMAKFIEESHIFVFSGGFSGGDEPDGSGKFIVNILNNPIIKEATHKFLRDGKLILGICNGFQALIKAGLASYGEIKELDDNSPTLFTNDINRHISRFVGTKVITNRSPWTSELDPSKRYVQPISHGEGKFTVNDKELHRLIEKNQIAFVYTDDENNQAVNSFYNANGSTMGIEGIISPCGQVLGKMAHCERYQDGIYKNMEANLEENETLWLDIFGSAVKYFRG